MSRVSVRLGGSKCQIPLRLVALSLVLAVVCGTNLYAQPAVAERVPVLIGFQQTPGPAEQALVRAFGGTVSHSYTLVPAVAATIPVVAIQGLQRNPMVTVVEPDVEVFALEERTPWGIEHINANAVHAANKGSGVKVCVIDSGMQILHQDLFPNYAGGYDYVNDDADPDDDNGHGTHVAGTIAAAINDYGVLGVAPEVDLYIYKILDATGSGDFSDAIAALQACKDIGGQITNNSYGSSGDPGIIVKTAFDAAYDAGVLNVAAAGNSGNPSGRGDKIGYPARYDSVMAVAAVDESHERPSWSSYGDDLDVSAPGVNILSTYPGGLAYMSGTSMASPHVAGAAALVASACSALATPDLIRERLTSTAENLGDPGWDKYYGYGLVQANLAVADCTPPAPVTDLDVVSVTAPDTVEQGTTSEVRVVVRNTGTEPASDFSVELTDNGAHVGSSVVPDLASGDDTTLLFNWSAPLSGSRTLEAKLEQVDYDTANNSASTVVTVTSPGTPDPVDFDLSVLGYEVRGRLKADLSWNPAYSVNPAAKVDIYRNDVLTPIKTAKNDGFYTDAIDNPGTYSYYICEAGNTSTCSSEVEVTVP